MLNAAVVTITMNPAIDKSTVVERIVPEAKLHCAAPRYEAGGGGINVSKALRRLGTDSMAIFPAGGHNGNMLRELLIREGIAGNCIAAGAETRENFIVLETFTNYQYRFNTKANPVEPVVASQCLDLLTGLPFKPGFLVVSGSLPEGVPEQFYADLAKWSAAAGVKFILDTSGPPLFLAADEQVFLLKPNLAELSQLAGKHLSTKEEAATAAREIILSRNCALILVSLGAEGALLVTKEGQDFVAAPEVKKQSSVGAGDSMVAGMVFGLINNHSLRECIRFAVACGTAATMNMGTELFHVEDVKKLYSGLMRE